jgi:hypothetical protein
MRPESQALSNPDEPPIWSTRKLRRARLVSRKLSVKWGTSPEGRCEAVMEENQEKHIEPTQPSVEDKLPTAGIAELRSGSGILSTIPTENRRSQLYDRRRGRVTCHRPD